MRLQNQRKGKGLRRLDLVKHAAVGNAMNEAVCIRCGDRILRGNGRRTGAVRFSACNTA